MVKSTKRRSTKVELAKITGIVTFQPVDPQPAISFTLTPLDPLDPEYDEFVQVCKPDLDRRPFKKARLFEQVNQDSRCLVSMLTVIKSASSETITLLVGEDEIRFLVHEKILCENSPFFESLCKSEWMEDHEKMEKLPEDDPELVDIMVYCKFL